MLSNSDIWLPRGRDDAHAEIPQLVLCPWEGAPWRGWGCSLHRWEQAGEALKPCADQRDGGESPSGWGWAELPFFPMQGCPATEGRFNCRLVIKNSKNSTP